MQNIQNISHKHLANWLTLGKLTESIFASLLNLKKLLKVISFFIATVVNISLL